MGRQIALLRGVNLGSRNRVAMPKLREALTSAGFDDVRTYVQSGNVVLSSRASSTTVARKVEQAVADTFGLEIDVVVRTRDELAAVVKHNPLGKVAKNPKLYQVTFLATKPKPEVLRKLEAATVAPEQLVHRGSELYAWHPNGVGRSKLTALLSGKTLGVTATARNWATVTNLLELADE